MLDTRVRKGKKGLKLLLGAHLRKDKITEQSTCPSDQPVTEKKQQKSYTMATGGNPPPNTSSSPNSNHHLDQHQHQSNAPHCTSTPLQPGAPLPWPRSSAHFDEYTMDAPLLQEKLARLKRHRCSFSEEEGEGFVRLVVMESLGAGMWKF